ERLGQAQDVAVDGRQALVDDAGVELVLGREFQEAAQGRERRTQFVAYLEDGLVPRLQGVGARRAVGAAVDGYGPQVGLVEGGRRVGDGGRRVLTVARA